MAGCDKVRKGARAQAWLLVPLGLVIALAFVLSNVYYWLLPGADVFYEVPWYLSVFGDELSAQWLFNGAFLAAFGWGVSRVYLALVESSAASRLRGSAAASLSESRGGLLGLVTAPTAASLQADEARAHSAAAELLAEEEAAAAAKAAAAAQRKPGAARAGAKGGSSSGGGGGSAPKPPKAAAGAVEASAKAL